MLTCVLFLLLGIFCCNGKKGFSAAAQKLCWAAAVISLGPLALGLRFMTVAGGLITVSLLAGAIVLHRASGESEASLKEIRGKGAYCM